MQLTAPHLTTTRLTRAPVPAASKKGPAANRPADRSTPSEWRDSVPMSMAVASASFGLPAVLGALMRGTGVSALRSVGAGAVADVAVFCMLTATSPAIMATAVASQKNANPRRILQAVGLGAALGVVSGLAGVGLGWLGAVPFVAFGALRGYQDAARRS